MRTITKQTLAAILLVVGSSGVAALAAGTTSIGVDNYLFGPGTVTVAKGTTVTWTNHDPVGHMLVDEATPREFESALLHKGDSFSHTFAKAGTYHYRCSIHSGMNGVIVVK